MLNFISFQFNICMIVLICSWHLCAYSKSSIILNPKSLFRFGIIADIQYADSDDALNFQGTHMRRYKQSLDIFQKAVTSWNSIPDKISCAVCLGDQLDGKTASTRTQAKCLTDLLKIADGLNAPLHYCYGNHDYYAFDRIQIYKHFTKKTNTDSLLSVGGNTSPEKLYYDWVPYPGWRFILLDSYDVSLIGYSSSDHLDLAKVILGKNNPNDLSVNGGWFKDLPREQFRYVPYNGGISTIQLNWLSDVLTKSEELEEKVVFFCHQPIYSPNKPQSVIWNSEDVLEVIHSFKNTCMWIAGHDHGGQYVQDKFGIHHVVPPAPLECALGESAFGDIEVFQDKFVLNWTGKGPDKSLLPWPKVLSFR